MTRLILLLGVLNLAACGGGGGGGSASPSAPSPVPPAVGNAVRIESEAGRAYVPRIATDSSGNATVVWVQHDSAGVTPDIYANRYDAATGTWSAAVPIDNQALDAFDPEIAIDPLGNAIAVWCQWDSTHVSVYANRYDAANGQWDTARLIGNATGDAQQPRIAIDFAGNIMVVWQVLDSSSFTYSVYANRYNVTSGGGWGSARLIETETGGASQPAVAVDTAGNALAAWAQRVGTDTFVYANRYDVSTGWGATGQPIEVDSGGQYPGPRIAFDPSDNAIAVWSKFDGTRTNILFNRYDATNGWNATAEPVENESDDAVSPQIAIDSAGNAIAVWHQFDAAGTSHSIKTSRYDAVTRIWGAVAPIATSADDMDFHLAIAPNDNAVLVWGQSADLWSHRYAVASGWGPAELVESNAGEINGPRVAIGANNSAIAVWSQDDSTGVSDIWVNINP